MGLIAMSERDLQRIEVLSKVIAGLLRSYGFWPYLRPEGRNS